MISRFTSFTNTPKLLNSLNQISRGYNSSTAKMNELKFPTKPRCVSSEELKSKNML